MGWGLAMSGLVLIIPTIAGVAYLILRSIKRETQSVTDLFFQIRVDTHAMEEELARIRSELAHKEKPVAVQDTPLHRTPRVNRRRMTGRH